MSEILLDHRDIDPASRAVTVITGAAETVQNIAEAFAIPYGSLPWDRTGGSHLFDMLNDLIEPQQVIDEMRRVVLSMPRVVKSTVEVGYNRRRDRYRVQFVPKDESSLVVIDADAAILAPTTPTTPVAPIQNLRLLRTGPNHYLLVSGNTGLIV